MPFNFFKLKFVHAYSKYLNFILQISELVKELEQRLYKFNIQPPKQQPNYKRSFTTDQEKLLFKVKATNGLM